ncbi:MAG: HNH endonuclease [Armatimonadetes bacterium]|nr:HNH endonuclease [Armatimonadota bacterium]
MAHSSPELLREYFRQFDSLHRHGRKDIGQAPHKPVLLLALLNEIEQGHITENLVRITPELLASFRAYWRALVPAGAWQERMVYPFRYLIQDGFWQLVRNGIPLTPGELGDPTSLPQLESMIDGARFAPELWNLLQDKAAIHALRRHLVRVYFDAPVETVQEQLPPRPVDYEVERLILEAHSRFRPAAVREKADDGYYIRHTLFPRVIKTLYDSACAICGLSACTDKGSTVVDAAHIMPFRQFHNDDPRNGIALCKNHHWGFDAGGFSISAEYRVVVSPQLREGMPLASRDIPIRLPGKTEHAPAPDALKWHRENILLR